LDERPAWLSVDPRNSRVTAAGGPQSATAATVRIAGGPPLKNPAAVNHTRLQCHAS